MNSAAPLLTTPTERLHLAWYILKSAAAAAEIGPAAEAAAPAIKEEAKNIFRRLWGHAKNAPGWLGEKIDTHPRTALGIGAGAGALGGAGLGYEAGKPDPSMLDQASHWIHGHPGTAAAAGAGLVGAGGLAALLAGRRHNRRRNEEE